MRIHNCYRTHQFNLPFLEIQWKPYMRNRFFLRSSEPRSHEDMWYWVALEPQCWWMISIRGNRSQNLAGLSQQRRLNLQHQTAYIRHQSNQWEKWPALQWGGQRGFLQIVALSCFLGRMQSDRGGRLGEILRLPRRAMRRQKPKRTAYCRKGDGCICEKAFWTR